MFVYPFVKSREWYGLPADERWRIMQGHIEVGREYPTVDNHTTYSFGLDDQEFVVAFDTDDVGTFLDLVQRLRTTEASRYTVRDTPSFTCIAMSLERALNALDGEPPGGQGSARCLSARLTHLKGADPILAGLIERAGPLEDARAGRPDRDDHYGALVRTITGQQLSVLAARAIYGRLTARFEGRAPTPKEILADEPEELRAAAGLSRAKVGFLRSLAQHVLTGELELERLDALEDAEVIVELTAVKGIGLWSAHMFLMFHLDRPDVLPVGDLGIRKAIQRHMACRRCPTPAEMEDIAAPWRPQRTLACRYLWRSLENEPS